MKNILLGIGGFFLLVIVMATITALQDETQSKTPVKKQEIELAQPKRQDYSEATLDFTSEKVDNSNIRVIGTTTLPNNTVIQIFARRMVQLNSESEATPTSFGYGVTSVTVKNGSFEAVVKINDTKFNEYHNAYKNDIKEVLPQLEVEAELNPKEQPKDIKVLLGDKGEALKSNPLMKQIGLSTNQYNTLSLIKQVSF